MVGLSKYSFFISVNALIRAMCAGTKILGVATFMLTSCNTTSESLAIELPKVIAVDASGKFVIKPIFSKPPDEEVVWEWDTSNNEELKVFEKNAHVLVVEPKPEEGCNSRKFTVTVKVKAGKKEGVAESELHVMNRVCAFENSMFAGASMIRGLGVTKSGRIYIGTDGQGLFEVLPDIGDTTQYKYDDTPGASMQTVKDPGNRIGKIQIADEDIWFSTPKGIQHMSVAAEFSELLLPEEVAGTKLPVWPDLESNFYVDRDASRIAIVAEVADAGATRKKGKVFVSDLNPHAPEIIVPSKALTPRRLGVNAPNIVRIVPNNGVLWLYESLGTTSGVMIYPASSLAGPGSINDVPARNLTWKKEKAIPSFQIFTDSRNNDWIAMGAKLVRGQLKPDFKGFPDATPPSEIDLRIFLEKGDKITSMIEVNDVLYFGTTKGRMGRIRLDAELTADDITMLKESDIPTRLSINWLAYEKGNNRLWAVSNDILFAISLDLMK